MKNDGGGKSDSKDDTQPIPVVSSYQEGSVQSVGGGPDGKDESDRSGDGTLPADSQSPPEPERGRDAFVSSEVSDKTSIPGKDPRKRS